MTQYNGERRIPKGARPNLRATEILADRGLLPELETPSEDDQARDEPDSNPHQIGRS